MSGRQCRECGCTDEAACIGAISGDPCYWVEPDLCSACAGRFPYYCADCGANFDDALNDAGRLECLVCGGPIVAWVA